MARPLDRMELLQANMSLPQRVEHRMFSLSQRDNDLHVLRQEIKPDRGVWPHRIMTNVTRKGMVELEGLYVDGQNQLMGPRGLGAYRFSYDYTKELQREFMREHRLFSFEQLDAYCDEHDFEVPDPTRVMLPPIAKGADVRVAGRFLSVPADFTFVLTVMGLTYEGVK